MLALQKERDGEGEGGVFKEKKQVSRSTNHEGA